MRAAADEYRMLARELREFGIDLSLYVKDGAPTLRIEIADSEVDREQGEGGKGLLGMLVGRTPEEE